MKGIQMRGMTQLVLDRLIQVDGLGKRRRRRRRRRRAEGVSEVWLQSSYQVESSLFLLH